MQTPTAKSMSENPRTATTYAKRVLSFAGITSTTVRSSRHTDALSTNVFNVRPEDLDRVESTLRRAGWTDVTTHPETRWVHAARWVRPAEKPEPITGSPVTELIERMGRAYDDGITDPTDPAAPTLAEIEQGEQAASTALQVLDRRVIDLDAELQSATSGERQTRYVIDIVEDLRAAHQVRTEVIGHRNTLRSTLNAMWAGMNAVDLIIAQAADATGDVETALPALHQTISESGQSPAEPFLIGARTHALDTLRTWALFEMAQAGLVDTNSCPQCGAICPQDMTDACDHGYGPDLDAVEETIARSGSARTL